jgi:hypothetical protein
VVDTVETAIYKMGVEGRDQIDQAAKSLDGLAVSEEKVTAATRTTTQGFERLLAKLDPQIRAEQQLQKVREQVARYAADGIGNEAERTRVIDIATRKYMDQVSALERVTTTQVKQNTTTSAMIAGMSSFNIASQRMISGMSSAGAANENFTGKATLARHELINLSRQFQDIGVSLSSGQSPFTVLIQQGTQIADVFASSNGTVGGFFKQTTAWFGSFLTAGRLAFGGVAAGVLFAVSALGSYMSAQRDVTRSLTGIGRASGTTAGDINTIASQGASPLGQSVSEAREFGSVLAATGKIGRDEIGSLVKLGHDFAVTLGTDSKEAAQALAKAMADPIKGADELNQRLGFMDAAQQRQIANLVAQNRVAEAQRIIIAGIQSSIASANEQTGFWSKTWTAISNAISNAYDGLGRVLSRATGIGETLDDQYAKAKRQLDDLQARSSAPVLSRGTTHFLLPRAACAGV